MHTPRIPAHVGFSQDDYDALVAGAGLLDRSSRGRIRLTGADRRAYLQGLLTNDILALAPGDGCYAALLTAQGRMVSDMRVSEGGDSLLIDLPGATADRIRQHLADFIFAEDVDVQDAGASLGQLGIYGPRAPHVLAGVLTAHGAADADARRRRLEDMRMNANAEWHFGERAVRVVRTDDYGIAGFDLFIDAAGAAPLAEACRDAGARDVPAAAADVTRVEAGRPEFGLDMDEGTIPLEAGIEDRAISLTKGCYVGQEIIIRVLHRGGGRVARRLVGLIDGSAEGRMVRGARLLHDARDVGFVTSVVPSPRMGRPIALGYVHRDFTEPGTALSTAADAGEGGSPVTVSGLPFTAPAAG